MLRLLTCLHKYIPYTQVSQYDALGCGAGRSEKRGVGQATSYKLCIGSCEPFSCLLQRLPPDFSGLLLVVELLVP